MSCSGRKHTYHSVLQIEAGFWPHASHTCPAISVRAVLACESGPSHMHAVGMVLGPAI